MEGPHDLPLDLANILQQLNFHPVGQQYFGGLGDGVDADEVQQIKDFTKLSTAVFIEPTFAVRYKVRTSNQHHQLLNLCELTADESGLYIYSYEKGLDEAAYKAALEAGTEYKDVDDGPLEDQWGTPPLKKFDFKTQKLFKVPSITIAGIYCIASKYGYVAVNNSGVVQVMHEASGKLVEGEFKASDSYHQTNNVFFGTMKQSNGEDQVVLLVSKNGGEITMYDLNQEGDRHVSKLRQHLEVRWNINHSAFGFFEFGKYLIGAPDYAEGPIIYQMDDAEQFTLVDTFLTFPHHGTSAMMCTWQAQGPLFAMATERGECVVWHFPSRERVKVLLNCGKKMKAFQEEEERRQRGETAPMDDETKSSGSSSGSMDYYSGSDQCVRIAKFNPVPLFNYILVYAESNYFIHIVDTRTWDEQIIQSTCLTLDPLYNMYRFNV
eukprot:TRINITY_DN435_c0_g1_i2.p1 TRINITY_DN435_c0_g1~~TRINITY_DN435_c0_g1_i2.p1  ORF type:complete len:466 (+),score=81.05 TRINITY_DN435_c0_g1_i2:91-1398(+)